MNHEIDKFSMQQEIRHKIFSTDESVSYMASSSFFGDINRALREFCIITGENIIMTKQYKLIPSILAFWYDFDNTLLNLSLQIATFFEKNTKRDTTTPPGYIQHQIFNQIAHFGYRNWNRYVLQQRFISEEIPSALKLLIPESPSLYPFIDIKLSSHLLKLIDILPDSNFEKIHYFLTRIIAQFLRLFLNHQQSYPENCAYELSQCSVYADVLYVYCKYSPKEFVIAKEKLRNKLLSLQKELDEYEMEPIDGFTIFDSIEYIELQKMIFDCNPEEYIKTSIPDQINYMYKIKIESGITGTHNRLENLLPVYNSKILPMFECATNIIKDSPIALQKFSSEFCKKMFPVDLLSEATTLFGQLNKYLHCVWTMCSNLPQYVIMISNAFITYFKPQLNSEVKKKNDERVQEIVANINSLVDYEFNKHPTMILARSTLLIPHQKDSELVGRARVLVEQAHIPMKMTYSIAELFDIVPFVKNKGDLFQGIAEFVQNQLLSQANPSVDLEGSLIDSMGQFTESQYITPLQDMLKEFRERFNMFEEFSQKGANFDPICRFAILPNSRWKQIVQRGELKAFDQFSSTRNLFKEYFSQAKKNNKLIWCDPSSVVEVKMMIEKKELLFLFNGVQFAIIKELLQAPIAMNGLVKMIQTDDLQEQINTLLESGLIVNYENKKDMYQFNDKLDEKINRNFAKKHTSAENLAINQMKEMDRRKAINSMIVRKVKESGRNGIKMKDLVKYVQDKSISYFSINPEVIRDQARELEITKYIKFKDSTSTRYIYVVE